MVNPAENGDVRIDAGDAGINTTPQQPPSDEQASNTGIQVEVFAPDQIAAYYQRQKNYTEALLSEATLQGGLFQTEQTRTEKNTPDYLHLAMHLVMPDDTQRAFTEADATALATELTQNGYQATLSPATYKKHFAKSESHTLRDTRREVTVISPDNHEFTVQFGETVETGGEYEMGPRQGYRWGTKGMIIDFNTAPGGPFEGTAIASKNLKQVASGVETFARVSQDIIGAAHRVKGVAAPNQKIVLASPTLH